MTRPYLMGCIPTVGAATYSGTRTGGDDFFFFFLDVIDFKTG